MTNTPRVNVLQSRFSIHHEGDLARLWDLARLLELELFEANETIADADDDCAAHNLYTVEESLRASRAISAAEGYEGPHTVFASIRDRIWWLEQQKEIARLREALEAVKAATALHAGTGPTFALVCAALEANPPTP